MKLGLAERFPRLHKELPRLMVFICVGLLSLGLTVGLYALVSRVIWPNGNKTLTYGGVVIFVTWINYLLNKRITFKANAQGMGALGRFATVAIIATGLNNIFFWIGHDLLHVYDLIVIIANTAIVAVFTFTSHRLFTFHEQPWRFLKKPPVL